MLRLEFTIDDMGATRVAPMAGPLAETVLALGAVTGRRPSPLGSDFLASARRRVSPVDDDLAAVLYTPCCVRDVFTLAGVTKSLREALAGLRHASSDDVALELGPDCVTPTSPGFELLPFGDPAAVLRMTTSLSQSYQRLVEPFWPMFRQLLETHRQRLVRELGDHGVRETLPRLTGGYWEGRVLVLPTAGAWTEEVRTGSLGGRGLLLAPTVLAPEPVPWFPLDRSQSAILFCPAVIPAYPNIPATRAAGGVVRLIGRARARILATLIKSMQGVSTTDTAAMIGVSAATASQHLTVLRDAGLVVSTREGQRMMHTITPLGQRLLRESGADTV